MDTVTGVTTLSETLAYYLNLRLSAKSQHMDVTIPEAVEQIIHLASGLPRPDTTKWAALAVGKMPKDVKAKAHKPDAEDGDSKPRNRGKWTEEHKAELVRLVEDEAFRTETLGADGTHNGNVNWSALARRYGFSGINPIHRQYQATTGKDPPGIKSKSVLKTSAPQTTTAAGGEDAAEQPPAKKAKKEVAASGKAATAAKATTTTAATTTSADGWTTAQCDELIKLVEDEDFRKQRTGKRRLKWTRLVDHLGKDKHALKVKYAALTGRNVDDV